MPLPLVNLLIRLQTALLCGVFLMLTACVAQQPISSKAEPVVNDPVIDLPIIPTSKVANSSIVDPVPLELIQVEPIQAEPIQEGFTQVKPKVKMASVTATSPPVSDLTTPAPNKAILLAKIKTSIIKKAAPVIKTVAPGAKKIIPVPLVSTQNPTDSVAFWLGEAGWAFEKDQLTTPKAKSAYYYLSKVLAKEPQNPLALAALEKIVQRYYVLLKASLNKGKVEQARVFWSRAKKIIPKHSELAKMRALIENHHVKQQMVVVSEPATEVPALRTQKLLLPVHLIKQQDKQLAQWLVMLAKKAHDLQATMLIVAPRDTQARWVYQAMNSADPEQRIRANIKHSRPARLEISYLARKDELEIYGN
tara:strand:- start:4202 stop:5290 length:1089 start_codon:yes stop_codon:yes gene_type:complete